MKSASWRILTVFAVLLCVASQPVFALQESGGPRCGSDFVQLGDRTFTVFERCGPPLEIQFIDIATEEWVYGPLAGYYYFIIFERGKVVEIESERG